MKFNKFLISISIQLILVIINCFFILHSFYETGLTYTRIHLIAILVIQFLLLLRSFNMNNRKIANILNSIKYNDLSFQSEKKEKKSDLNTAIKDTIQAFKELKFEKESLFTLLDSVLHNIPMAVLVFNDTGDIKLSNNSFLKLFRLKQIHNINELNTIQEGISEKLKNINTNYSLILHLDSMILSQDKKSVKLSIKSSHIVLQKEQLSIISLQDIGDELAYQEIESWQKLMSVITHELMNSIAPIESLTQTLINLFEENNYPNFFEDELHRQNFDLVHNGLKAIDKRSKGLKRFISSYNKYSDIPQPNKIRISVHELFKDISILVKDSLAEYNIDFTHKVFSDNMHIYADEKMIFQVLLNLIRNSIYFVKQVKDPKIDVCAFYSNDRTFISIVDNGTGIEKEIEDSIFVPFFSTKKEGTGIGLSISKKIMQMHKGDLIFSSIPYKKTEFILKF